MVGVTGSNPVSPTILHQQNGEDFLDENLLVLLQAKLEMREGGCRQGIKVMPCEQEFGRYPYQ